MIALKTSLLLATALILTAALRRQSAALRHLILTIAMAAVLILPFISVTVPTLTVPVLFATTAVVSAKPTSGFELAAVPQIIWIVGSLLAFTRLFIALLAIAKKRRQFTQVETLHSVQIYESPANSMPIAFGILQPSIAIPADAATWTRERREAVIQHELAHLRRRDPATQLLANIALAIYWWNPLAWLALRQLLKEQERAADDLVLATGTRATDYAEHLLHIASGMLPAPVTAALPMVRKPQLEDRLKAILDPSTNRRHPTRTTAILTAAACLALLLPVSAATTPHIYRVGNGVTPPSVLSKVDPDYTEEARAAKLSGRVALLTEIAPDGLAHHISVTQKLGLGLDETAIAAVSKWHFKPGAKDGHPVTVLATIEVNFRLQ